jgi:uncharacterized lipoprotein YmbA
MNKQHLYPYFRNVTFTLIMLVITGCGTSPKPDFYHLEQAASTQLTGLERGIAIGIGPVNMAPYLDRPQIVTREGNHKLKLSEFNRWSEPLKSSVSRVIAVKLSNLLETNRVFLLPRREKSIPLDYRVSIDVARFDGQLGGSAYLTARWSLYDKDQQVLLTKVSIITEASEGKSFEHLVAAENLALQIFSHEIAEAIKTDQD